MSAVISIFSRITAFFMSLFLMITGFGNTSVKITEQPSQESAVISYEIRNNSLSAVFADKYFVIEKNDGGEWKELTAVEGASTEDIGILLKPFGSVSFRIDLAEYYGGLPEAGEYRLVLPSVGANAVFEIA